MSGLLVAALVVLAAWVVASLPVGVLVGRWLGRRSGTCQCGHDQASHEHYRPGSDCGLCDCPQYSPGAC